MKRTKEEGNISTTCSKNGKTVRGIEWETLSSRRHTNTFLNCLSLRWRFYYFKVEMEVHTTIYTISFLCVYLPPPHYLLHSDFYLFSLYISRLYNLNNLLYRKHFSLKYYRVKHFKKHGKKCYYRYLTIAIQYPSKWKSEYQHQSINRQYFEKQHLCG